MELPQRGTPSDNALRFEITGEQAVFEAYIDLVSGIDQTQAEVDCRYRESGSSGNWTWLISSTLYVHQLSTKEATDEKFNVAIDAINQKIKDLFGVDASPIPEAGIERIQWFIENGLEFSGGEIKRRA